MGEEIDDIVSARGRRCDERIEDGQPRYIRPVSSPSASPGQQALLERSKRQAHLLCGLSSDKLSKGMTGEFLSPGLCKLPCDPKEGLS